MISIRSECSYITQVLLGLAVGFAIDNASSHCSNFFLSKLQWSLPNGNNNYINLFISSMVLLVSGVGIYHGLQGVGLDPKFSVPLAMEYCQERSWVHPDTTPFYSLMRSSGALLGMGVVAYLVGDRMTAIERGWPWTKRGGADVKRRLSGLVCSLVVVAILHSKCVPSFVESGSVVFYSVALFRAALIPCITFLPCSICVFCSSY